MPAHSGASDKDQAHKGDQYGWRNQRDDEQDASRNFLVLDIRKANVRIDEGKRPMVRLK